MDTSAAIQIIVLIILLLLSAFFSSAETALTTANKIKMRSLAEEGNHKANTVLEVTDNSSKMLSAILIGNNIVNLSASSLTTTIAYQFGGTYVALATAIITVLILIFGEIVPKTAANLNSESMSLKYAFPIKLIMFVVTPISIIINFFARIILRILGIDPDAKTDTMTETELRTLVDVGHEDGVIEEEEREMINNVFDLGDAKAKDVMVPAVNVTFADVNSSYQELLDIFREDKYTRLPIYEETTDNVIGTINMKDLLLFDNKKEFHIRDILREAHFTYEHKNISELLVEMRQAAFNIAIVLGEYGETAGLITLEDILEEIVGEIHDEYDVNEEEDVFKEISKFEFIIEGSMNLDDVNDRINLNLQSEDYDSLGGYIIEHLDRIPDENDELVTDDKIRMVVDSLSKNRVEKVHVYLPEDFYDEADKKED